MLWSQGSTEGCQNWQRIPSLPVSSDVPLPLRLVSSNLPPKQESKDEQHTNISPRDEESNCSNSLTVSETRVVSCVQLQQGKQIPHRMQSTWVIGICADYWQAATNFGICSTFNFLRLQYCRIPISEAVSSGDSVRFTVGLCIFLLLHPFSSGYLYRIIFFSPDCLQLISEKVEVTGRVKTHNLIFILSINHAWLQPAI